MIENPVQSLEVDWVVKVSVTSNEESKAVGRDIYPPVTGSTAHTAR